MRGWRPGLGIAVMMAATAVLAGLVVAATGAGWRVHALGRSDVLLSQPQQVESLADADLRGYAVVWAPATIAVPENDVVCDDSLRDAQTGQSLCVNADAAAGLLLAPPRDRAVVDGLLDPWRVEKGVIVGPLRGDDAEIPAAEVVQMAAERAYRIPRTVTLAAPALAALLVVVPGLLVAAPALRRCRVAVAAAVAAAVAVRLPGAGVAELDAGFEVRLPEIASLRYAPAIILVAGLAVLLTAARRRTQVAVVSLVLVALGLASGALGVVVARPGWSSAAAIAGTGSMRPVIDAYDTVVYEIRPLRVGDVAVRGTTLHRVVGTVDVGPPPTEPWQSAAWPASIEVPFGSVELAGPESVKCLGLELQVVAAGPVGVRNAVWRGDANPTLDTLIHAEHGAPPIGTEVRVVRAVVPLGQLFLRPALAGQFIAMGVALPLLHAGCARVHRRLRAVEALVSWSTSPRGSVRAG